MASTDSGFAPAGIPTDEETTDPFDISPKSEKEHGTDPSEWKPMKDIAIPQTDIEWPDRVPGKIPHDFIDQTEMFAELKKENPKLWDPPAHEDEPYPRPIMQHQFIPLRSPSEEAKLLRQSHKERKRVEALIPKGKTFDRLVLEQKLAIAINELHFIHWDKNPDHNVRPWWNGDDLNRGYETEEFTQMIKENVEHAKKHGVQKHYMLISRSLPIKWLPPRTFDLLHPNSAFWMSDGWNGMGWPLAERLKCFLAPRIYPYPTKMPNMERFIQGAGWRSMRGKRWAATYSWRMMMGHMHYWFFVLVGPWFIPWYLKFQDTEKRMLDHYRTASVYERARPIEMGKKVY